MNSDNVLIVFNVRFHKGYSVGFQSAHLRWSTFYTHGPHRNMIKIVAITIPGDFALYSWMEKNSDSLQFDRFQVQTAI